MWQATFLWQGFWGTKMQSEKVFACEKFVFIIAF